MTVGLIVLGLAERDHALSSAGVWGLVAFNCLTLAVRIRKRLKEHGRAWWRTWES